MQFATLNLCVSSCDLQTFGTCTLNGINAVHLEVVVRLSAIVCCVWTPCDGSIEYLTKTLR